MDDPILWLTVALFISLAANGILGFALYGCLPDAQVESKPTRTDDGEPWAPLNVSEETNAWNKMALVISKERSEPAKPAKTRRVRKAKALLAGKG